MRFVEWLMDILVASISRRSLTISVVLLLIYAVLALVVGGSWLATVDTEVLLASQRLAGIQLDYLLTALTPLATAEFSVGWLALGTWLLWRSGFGSRSLSILWIGCTLPLEVLSKFVVFQPPVGGDMVRLLYDFPLLWFRTSYTFPSGHAARTAFFCLLISWAIWRFGRRNAGLVIIQLLVAALALLMWFSRFYFGHHWPTDVLGGILLGAAFAVPAITALERPPAARR